MSKEIVKKYVSDELTIVWKPHKCIHAGVCVKTLPQVYDPKAKPWITMEKASTEVLKAQIDLCPSAALSYEEPADKESSQAEGSNSVQVEIMENGPLLIHGHLVISSKDLKSESKNSKTAFCRCGHSQNKPYCDGNHVKKGFEG
ncbi:MAG: (4Fe-4S)-binding protein [Gammaproteobacteria bacterium]|nr:(4Fe-4S)-binding protein [Gammaproteobacteria bacterium]